MNFKKDEIMVYDISLILNFYRMQQSISDSCARVPLEVEEMHNVEIDDCYNKNQMPPTIDGKGIMVNISMNLNSLLSIDEPTQVRNLWS